MSQQKVDKYKEYKKNRKQIIAKEKRKKGLGESYSLGYSSISSMYRSRTNYSVCL